MYRPALHCDAPNPLSDRAALRTRRRVQRAFGKDGATRPILHRAEPACDVAAASAVSIASAARIFASKMMEAAELNRAEGSGHICAKTQDFAMKLGDSVQ